MNKLLAIAAMMGMGLSQPPEERRRSKSVSPGRGERGHVGRRRDRIPSRAMHLLAHPPTGNPSGNSHQRRLAKRAKQRSINRRIRAEFLPGQIVELPCDRPSYQMTLTGIARDQERLKEITDAEARSDKKAD